MVDHSVSKPGEATATPPADVEFSHFDERSQGREQEPRKREAIILAAAHLFDEVGYHKTSLATIASAVGIAKPTLYHYFSSKEEILFWIHDEFISRLIDRQEARWSSSLSTPQMIRCIVHDILVLMETHKGHVKAFFENYRELTERWRAPMQLKRTQYEGIVVDVIQGGVATGSLRPIDPRLAALALFGMCNSAYQWYSPDGPMSAVHIADLFAGILLSGLESNLTA